MTKIENKAQYDWAVNRVEELLPLVDDNTPKDDKNLIELELLSNLVAESILRSAPHLWPT